MKSWAVVGVVGVGLMTIGAAGLRACAQASAIPSAQTGGDVPQRSAVDGEDGEDAAKGLRLLDGMVAALGGETWTNRQEWVVEGRSATFYKGQPDAGSPRFVEYHRAHPFGERVVTISHYGALIATDHADVADVWTDSNGYEITYKGTKPLPAKVVEEFRRRREHSVETVVQSWLKQPGVIVTYEGQKMVERRLAEQVGVLSAGGDAVTLELDQSTHLPLSLSFEWRDPVYRDWNTDVEQFADYHEVQGIMTPYAITTLHNGDVTGERFVTKVVYGVMLAEDVFDPNHPLEKK